jgi:hypothetical protein
MLDMGWEDGTIGAFQRLSEIAQQNRAFMQEVADTSASGCWAASLPPVR